MLRIINLILILAFLIFTSCGDGSGGKSGDKEEATNNISNQNETLTTILSYQKSAIFKLPDGTTIKILSNTNKTYLVSLDIEKINTSNNIIQPLSPVYKLNINTNRMLESDISNTNFKVYIRGPKININNLNSLQIFYLGNNQTLIPIDYNYNASSKELTFSFERTMIANKSFSERTMIANESFSFFISLDKVKKLFDPVINDENLAISPYWLNYPITSNKPIILKFNKDIKDFDNLNMSIYIDSELVYKGPIRQEINLGNTKAGLHTLLLLTKLPTPIKNHKNILESATFFITQKLTNYSLEDSTYQDLLKKYAPILELGNIQNLTSSYTILTNWYGNYTKELYIPICLNDYSLYTQGEEIFDIENYSNIPYWLRSEIKDSINLKFGIIFHGKFYQTSLSNLWEFPSIATGTCLSDIFGQLVNKFIHNFLGYYYFKMPNYYYYIIKSNDLLGDVSLENGAQYLTIALISKPCIYADVKEDDDFIYLQYWFYYPYDPKTPNKLTSKLVAQHIGDNEFMEVVLDKSSLKPLWVFFAHHNNNQKFAYIDPKSLQPLFEWNTLGFGSTKGIGGAIVLWNKVNKINSHPIAYIALGSHGVYFRKGFYAVDDPHLDVNTSNFDIDLLEYAGNGIKIYCNACNNNTASSLIYKINIINGIIGNNGDNKYLLSPLSSFGENVVKACVQRDVRFFPYSEFYYNFEKIKCFYKVNDESSDYDYKINGIKLKVANDYCRSIIVNNYLFPDKNIFQNIKTQIQGKSVSISGVIDISKRASKENLNLNSSFKLEINWDYPYGNWKDIAFGNLTLFENFAFYASHFYENSGKYTIALRFITDEGSYVDRYIQILVKEDDNNSCNIASPKEIFSYIKRGLPIKFIPFFNLPYLVYCDQIEDWTWDEQSDNIVYLDCHDLNKTHFFTLRLASYYNDNDLVYYIIYGPEDIISYSSYNNDGCIDGFINTLYICSNGTLIISGENFTSYMYSSP